MKGEKPKKTIMLVEDEAILAMSCKQSLEKYGYSVIHALNGKQALSIISSTPGIDLVLMDINLGEAMDGTQLAAAILQNHDIPVVFLSSHTEPEIVEKTEKITSYGYVVKNSSATVLDASIKMAFKLVEVNKKLQDELAHRVRLESALEKRIIALTKPLEQAESIAFSELFDLISIQRIQDDFSKATGIASIITSPNGTPLTKPSNFTYLCSEIFRKNDISCANCRISDAELGKRSANGPIIHPCLSGGLWDAGASITVGNHHVANWLIGQVRDETQTEENILRYAREIGADEKTVLEAFRNVPSMSLDKFTDIAQALYSFAKQLSDIAYQNVQQARFIAERRQVEAKLNRLISTMAEGLALNECVFDAEGEMIDYKVIEVNDAFYSVAGVARGQAVGKLASQLYAMTPELIRSFWVNNKDRKTVVHSEYFSPRSSRWFYVSTSPIENGRFVTSFLDITQRKQVEEGFRASEERLKEAQALAHIGVWDWDAASDTVSWTEELYRIAGRDPQLPALSYKEHPQLYSAESWERLSHSVEQAMRTGESYQLELNLIRPDGEIRIVNAHGGARYDTNGRVRGLYGTIQDITARKHTEQALQEKEAKYKELLAEKELILKEVNHRIKNNMATMEGLLQLHALRLSETSAIAALEDAGRRMQSMRLLYDKLYQSAGSIDLPIDEYLSPLVDAVLANFADSAMVKVYKQIGDFTLDAKRLQPLGIIVNELLTNIMKYAFIDKSQGIITVSASLEQGRALITVQDNGIGIPAAVDFGNSSGFGLTLVHMLAVQMDASLRIERDSGTKMTLEFAL